MKDNNENKDVLKIILGKLMDCIMEDSDFNNTQKKQMTDFIKNKYIDKGENNV